VKDQASHPYKPTGKIIVLYILIFLIGLLVNYEMEKELKKEVVTQFKVLSQHLPGGD
jgi:glucose-6-phosphate-specific signal transduction histidine kinase